MADPKRNLIYGLHAVSAALDRAPERLLELWIAQGRDAPRVSDLKARAERAGVHVHAVASDALGKLVGEVAHQGAVASMRPSKGWDEHDLSAALDNLPGDALLLILDGVTDPHNLGACLRTAEAAGAHAVVIPKDRAATLDATARKVAAGAAEFIPVATVTNLARALDSLKERGIWIVGTDGEAEESLYSVDLKRPVALVLGAEGSGMRRLTRDKCDFLARIPMAGHMQSLNVSVAAGIALFEVLRQRSG
ncbi:MAG TPA: 23S rRNA (guanosine(2251)-2'-O)-methyltransferase RlmB [Steroidobacteraceae bacterium]